MHDRADSRLKWKRCIIDGRQRTLALRSPAAPPLFSVVLEVAGGGPEGRPPAPTSAATEKAPSLQVIRAQCLTLREQEGCGLSHVPTLGWEA